MIMEQNIKKLVLEMGPQRLRDLLIAELQRNDGIVMGTVLRTDTGEELTSFHSPFFTALVWHEVWPLLHQEFKSLYKKACRFLLETGSCEAGWHFFPDGHDYPTDSDDTAIIAHHLWTTGYLKDVSSVIRLLMANRTPNGEYYVWLVNENGHRRNNTVDPIVNVNVAAFVRLSANGAIDTGTATEDLLAQFPDIRCSGYYDDEIICTWLVSRWDRYHAFPGRKQRSHKFRAQLQNLIRKRIHIPLLMSAAATYGSNRLIHTIADAVCGESPKVFIDKKPWIFRHLGRNIGYSCPLLDVAVLARIL